MRRAQERASRRWRRPARAQAFAEPPRATTRRAAGPHAARLPVEAGQAPALPWLVLIPGTLCDRRLFAAQARALHGQARIWCVELDGLEADVGAWAEQLLRRLPPRFSVAGFSLGGLLALELLRRAPTRVERLALVASNAEAGSRRAQQQRLRATRPDARWIELRRCGHFIPLERPRQLSRLLAQWLAAPPRGV